MRFRLSKGRRITVACIISFLFIILAVDLISVQLIHAEDYEKLVSAVTAKSSVISASRGEVVDCNGNKLIYNDQSYNLIFEGAYFPSAKEQENRNKIILSLINLLEKKKVEWNNNLPLEFDKQGEIQFKKDSENEIKIMKSSDMLNVNEYATAQNCYDILVSDYALEEYEPKDAIKIAAVCYDMKRNYFDVNNTYVFAENVPDDIVSYVKENNSFYQGVDVEVTPIRAYSDGKLAPHILGMTGLINAEEYAEYKDKGYKMDDFVGKSGIELAMEEYLKGKDGEKTVYTDDEGNKTTKITKEPENGNTVVLTINSGLQKVASDALREALQSYSTNQKNMVRDAGAVVVLNCADSSVLACASYPTYDITTYGEDVGKLSQDSAAPLWNRALMSTYACGSTAKPSVAIAALEEGTIDEDYTVYCNGSYTYLGQKFKCEQAHEHIFVDVVHAIDESCNTFFMEVGKIVGIEKMNEYRTQLGLGAKTGCELNEAVGVLDSPEYRASINQEWLPGYTVQSAIGQAGNLFTPIQLANYVNTIANGGTRYRTHFVKSIKSADYSKTVSETAPEVVCDTGISEETLDIVKRGMREVGVTGYCAKYFSHLPVEVACKTGTSQEIRKLNGISVKINNGFLIAFAPYDEPEIAIAAVGEGMVSGVYVAPVIAAIVEYWCGMSGSTPEVQPENAIIP